MSTDIAESALLALASSLVDEVAAARIAEVALSGQAPAKRDWRELGPLALGAAEAANPPEYQRRPGPSAVVPLAKSEKACGYCGNPDASQLTEGADQRYGFADDWLCAPEHERACTARRERRWPPDPSKVPAAVLAALSAADDAQAARRQPAARQQHEPREPLPGWQESQYGALDTRGGWHPGANPFYAQEWAASPWGHSLRHHANRTHLLGHDAFLSQAYGRSQGPGRDALTAAHWGAQEAPGGQGGQSVPGGGQDAQAAPQGEGGDIPMGQVKPLEAELPAAARQVRPRGPQYGRRGRKPKLAYSGRKPARKPAKSHLDGSDSLGSSPDTGGPDGSASSAER